jgi:peptidoglycan glycosyltransferase
LNAQIRQVYGLFVVLFALLVGFTSYWAVLDANGLENNPDNRRGLIKEQSIPRGLIFASDGKTKIAVNRAEREGDTRTFVREYPQRGLFAHPVGYSFITNGRRSLEQSRNDDLAGQENEFE